MSRLGFFVIGAQKAGTTSLWHLLRDHPQLALPAAKEVPFFTDELRYGLGLERYEATCFEDSDDGALRGTVSPQYMTGVTGPSQPGMPIDEVVARLADTVPRAKLIALLRDPVERAISHHRMSSRRGLDRRPLERALQEQLHSAALSGARLQPSETNGYVIWGEYGRVLAAYRQRFSRSQLLLLLTSELERDPDAALGRVLRFLEVDSAWRPDDLAVRRFVGGDDSRVSPEDAKGLLKSLAAAVPGAPSGALSVAFEEWNAVSGPTTDRLSAGLESRLREHFASDAALLREACGIAVPWASPPAARARRVPAVDVPEVSVVVLVHNTPAEAEAAVDSIVQRTTGAYELVLVDNGSSAPSQNALMALADRCGARLVRLERNVGFSAGSNAGIRAARGDEIALLNSDVVVTTRWLVNLRAALHSAPDVAAVGPRSNFARARQGGIWLDDTSPAGVERFARFFNHSDPHRWFELDWLMGYAILARREALEAVASFDETIPDFGGEDQDLCERLLSAGYRVLCAGDTFIFHAGHRTFALAGINRTATRLRRQAADPVHGGRNDAVLVRGANGWIFEVRDGLAYHVENVLALNLIREGRSIAAADGAVDALPVGPPISLCRVAGTDEVFVIHAGHRRRVTGDRQRIRRLFAVTMVERDELEMLPEGSPVAVEHALREVPKIKTHLPANPAQISPDRLAGLDVIVDELAAALKIGVGYALIRLGIDEALLLNEGMWPAASGDLRHTDVSRDGSAAALALRNSIIDADAVGVVDRHDEFVAAPLLEQLLFHFDLYPRLRCSGSINYALMGRDPATGSEDWPAPLHALLAERPIALVCPGAVAGRSRAEVRQQSERLGLVVKHTVVLNSMREVDDALLMLAARREVYDAVLVAGDIPAKPLCSRLARELGVVALDMGHAIDDCIHPRFDSGTTETVRLRGQVDEYLAEASTPLPEPPHELEGELVRSRGEGAVLYVERGLARSVPPALLGLFDREPLELEPTRVAELARGVPLCAVRERLTGTYVLLDGKKIPVRLGLPIVEVADLALAQLPDADRELTL